MLAIVSIGCDDSRFDGRRRVRKIVMTGFVAAGAVLGSVVPAVTASAVTSGTAAVRLPAAAAALAAAAAPARPGATIAVALSTIGDRISCASPTACLAVGTDSGSSGNEIPIAQALHGTAWKSVAVKTPKGATSAAL